MAKNVQELTATYSALALVVAGSHWKDTIRIKSNGAAHGPIIGKAFPILDRWAHTKVDCKKVLGDSFTGICMALCGRREFSHAAGIIALKNNGISESDAKASCQTVNKNQAESLLNVIIQADKAMEATAKRKAPTAKPKAPKAKASKGKSAPSTKPAPIKMPAGNAG